MTRDIVIIGADVPTLIFATIIISLVGGVFFQAGMHIWTAAMIVLKAMWKATFGPSAGGEG